MIKFGGGVLAAAMLLVVAASRALADTADDPSIGIYSTQIVFPAGLRGELTLAKTGETWRAAIAGSEAQAPNAARLKFAFPTNGGELRVAVEANDLGAFWITPPSARFATRSI